MVGYKNGSDNVLFYNMTAIVLSKQNVLLLFGVEKTNRLIDAAD